MIDKVLENNSKNNGGSTDYYKLPIGAKNLQDLVEHKGMNFAQGNIFKAIYRANSDSHSSYERDLNKIIWFAQRELERIKIVEDIQPHEVHPLAGIKESIEEFDDLVEEYQHSRIQSGAL